MICNFEPYVLGKILRDLDSKSKHANPYEYLVTIFIFKYVPTSYEILNFQTLRLFENTINNNEYYIFLLNRTYNILYNAIALGEKMIVHDVTNSHWSNGQ